MASSSRVSPPSLELEVSTSMEVGFSAAVAALPRVSVSSSVRRLRRVEPERVTRTPANAGSSVSRCCSARRISRIRDSLFSTTTMRRNRSRSGSSRSAWMKPVKECLMAKGMSISARSGRAPPSRTVENSSKWEASKFLRAEPAALARALSLSSSHGPRSRMAMRSAMIGWRPVGMMVSSPAPRAVLRWARMRQSAPSIPASRLVTAAGAWSPSIWPSRITRESVSRMSPWASSMSMAISSPREMTTRGKSSAPAGLPPCSSGTISGTLSSFAGSPGTEAVIRRRSKVKAAFSSSVVGTVMPRVARRVRMAPLWARSCFSSSCHVFAGELVFFGSSQWPELSSEITASATSGRWQSLPCSAAFPLPTNRPWISFWWT